MKIIFSALILMLSVSAFSQDGEKPCNQLPIALPDTKAKAHEADAHFQANLPEGYGTSTFAHGVFKVTVDCNGDVKNVYYQDGSMEEADIAHFSDAIKTMEWKAAKNADKKVTSNAFISLKINAGQASCAVQ